MQAGSREMSGRSTVDRSNRRLLAAFVVVVAAVALLAVWMRGDGAGAAAGLASRVPEAVETGAEVFEPVQARVTGGAEKRTLPATPAPAAEPEPAAAPAAWWVRYRLVDAGGEKLAWQDFQGVGIGMGDLTLRCHARDETVRVEARVPEMDDSMDVADGTLRGTGDLPATLVVALGNLELGRAVVTSSGDLVELAVDLTQAASDCYQVRFRLQQGAFAWVVIRGSTRLQKYFPATFPTHARLDGVPGQPGEHELAVGLPVGEYRYEAVVFAKDAEGTYARQVGRGEFEVVFDDQVIDVIVEAAGALEGAIGLDIEGQPFVQVLPEEGACAQCWPPVRIEGGRYRVDELAPGRYRVVVFDLGRDGQTLTFLQEAPVDVLTGESTQLDLRPGRGSRLLREWVLRSSASGFYFSVSDVDAGGTRHRLLDGAQGANGVRLALPRETRPEFAAVPILHSAHSVGPDFRSSVKGRTTSEGEVWFDFEETGRK